ncbi:PolC-type DNA polymerase III [Acetobacterium sp.]|jgi:DNA polymerase-3 subunit epsilon|uniref:3'-5' exonuclease n=1 Tax=Acetobacterium sp. TaxID=1872094 RepID=UPI000CB0C422|nr:3'-5' exonuclease [Acetobacterium sp.]MDO9493638.1 3'-5' exonuclease [Acetobacterium sp.]PKM74877.1 MAG: DNA polymerase III subunit epsilon [Firmicutes bacterium HGW-Firmicutes-17]
MNKYGTLREKKGSSLIEFPDNYVIIDIETTGFSPRNCEIIEIGAVKVRDNKITSVFQMLIKPNNPISSYISNLTGITNHMLSDAKPVATVLDAFVSFTGDNILIGHKVNSDVNFLYDHCKTNIGHDLTNDFIDIRELFRERQRSVLNNQLTSLCEKCAIQNTNAHRALSDCLVSNNLYQSLKYHDGSIACVEELDTLILATEFNLKHSPYKKKCQNLSAPIDQFARISL